MLGFNWFTIRAVAQILTLAVATIPLRPKCSGRATYVLEAQFEDRRYPMSPTQGPSLSFATAEELLAAIVDSSEDAIISKNLEGIVATWNHGAQRIFGYSAEEMVGQPILHLVPPERAGEESRILAKLQRGERIDHYETVRVRKDGRKIDVSLTISPIRNSSGNIVGASKIARDITEQKLARSRLADAHEQLKRADRMKSEFISTLSHELRTPLAAISGWLQILREDPSKQELDEGIEIIERNVRVQSQLVNDLLDMSRIESGKITLDIQRIDLPAVVTAAIEAVRPAATTKEIRLTFAFSSVEGLVMADRNRIQQVLSNLLNNAIKFTPKSGRIHVTIERVNSHVEVAVADNGIGISSEHLESIFDRFSQADASITRRHGGLGLGLAIAKNLVELHGGKLSAHSPGHGHGATFIVNLPLLPVHFDVQRAIEEQRTATVDASLNEPSLTNVKILVVDDDIDSARAVQTILQRREAHVRIAHSMEDALALFAEAVPDVLISDIGMPVHDGYELISRIRNIPGGAAIPAIALTALARTEDRTRALRAGYQLHLAKPADGAELVAVVRNLADLRMAFQPK